MATPETDEKESPGLIYPDAAGPLLDLTTLITRPTIAIEHERVRHVVEILSPDELSIIDSHRFGLWGRRIQQLAEDDSAEAEAELTELIDKVARRVAVGVPDAIYRALSGAHKQAISDVFTGLLLRNRLGVAGAIAKAAGVEVPGLPEQGRPTGERQSRAWSAFTARRQRGGWLKRLLPWSGRS